MKAPQQGMALIEALVASAVLGIGLLGASQLTLKALQTARDTHERQIAHMLAQEAMDCVLSRSTCPAQDSAQVQGVRYTREMQITPRSDGLQDVLVSVQWASSTPSADRLGKPGERLQWHSSVSQVPGWLAR